MDPRGDSLGEGGEQVFCPLKGVTSQKDCFLAGFEELLQHLARALDLAALEIEATPHDFGVGLVVPRLCQCIDGLKRDDEGPWVVELFELGEPR